MATTVERQPTAVGRRLKKAGARYTAVQTKTAEGFMLHGVSWRTYELLIADHDDQRAPRFTYDRGELEIVSPSFEHERVNQALANLVVVVAEVLTVDAVSAGT